MSNSPYDIVENFEAWTFENQTVEWPNPNFHWYTLGQPKRLTFKLYTKPVEGMSLSVWYHCEGNRRIIYGA